MVFSLVGPLIVKMDLEPLRIIMEAGIPWPTGELTAGFEYDDRAIFHEDSGRPTSVDLAISGEETGRIFIEAKLVETEFGDCSVFSGGDCDGKNPASYGLEGCYLQHIGRKYWERMNEFGFSLGSGPICPFVSYYQLFRQIGRTCTTIIAEWITFRILLLGIR